MPSTGRDGAMAVDFEMLEGRHVRLEPVSRRHREALHGAAMDGDVWRSEMTFIPATLEATGAYIEEALAAHDSGNQIPFVIIHRHSGRVLGTTRYRAIQVQHRRLEIGSTWLAASAQRTSANSEAKYLLLRHAFERLGCERVELLTDAMNLQARRAIERLGAREEGVLQRHMIMSGGRHRDSVCYSIIRPEWDQVKRVLESRMRSYDSGGATDVSD